MPPGEAVWLVWSVVVVLVHPTQAIFTKFTLPFTEELPWELPFDEPAAALSVCQDASERCGDWAWQGECRTNPLYMLRRCPVSCDACGGTWRAEDEGERRWRGPALTRNQGYDDSRRNEHWQRDSQNDNTHQPYYYDKTQPSYYDNTQLPSYYGIQSDGMTTNRKYPWVGKFYLERPPTPPASSAPSDMPIVPSHEEPKCPGLTPMDVDGIRFSAVGRSMDVGDGAELAKESNHRRVKRTINGMMGGRGGRSHGRSYDSSRSRGQSCNFISRKLGMCGGGGRSGKSRGRSGKGGGRGRSSKGGGRGRSGGKRIMVVRRRPQRQQQDYSSGGRQNGNLIIHKFAKLKNMMSAFQQGPQRTPKRQPAKRLPKSKGRRGGQPSRNPTGHGRTRSSSLTGKMRMKFGGW